MFSFAQGQNDSIELAPYLKYRNLPAFQLRILDKPKVFNTFDIPKGKPTIFVLFSPDCDHCEQISNMITDSIASFAKAKIYMISPMELVEIKKFTLKNGLNEFKQITVGQDFTFFFGSFFKASTVPFIVIYDKNKQFVSVIKRLRKIDELIDVIKGLDKH
jgi:glutaredoxin